MSQRAEADTVAVRVSEGIAWVKFNRPEKRNCMSPQLNRQMLRVIDDLEFRDDVGVLVLSTPTRSEEHTSELQSQSNLVCRLLLEKKKKTDVQKKTTQDNCKTMRS